MIEVFCDGSGTVAHEPACIGVVIFEFGKLTCEASEFVGLGTNNYAELRAIRRGIWLASQIRKQHSVSVPTRLYSDSMSSLGLIARGFQAKANVELVQAIRKQAKTFHSLSFIHVNGHSGVYGNEVADFLAWRARRNHYLTEGVKLKSRVRPLPLDPGKGGEQRKF